MENQKTTIKEKRIINTPEPITLKVTETIVEQMKKNICKICNEDGSKGTGFFCKIPIEKNNILLPTLITNNHVIDKEKLENKENKITILDNNNNITEISLKKRFKYTNETYDVTIIEIQKKDNLNYNFLEIEDNIILNQSNTPFLGESIYILQFPGKEEVSVSYGIIKKDIINDYDFNHLCSTDKGSSGSPILSIKNNKVIGIHKEQSSFNFNKATFLKSPIQEFIQKYNEFITTKFCKKYNLNLEDIEETLNLSSKDIGNDDLHLLTTIKPKTIKELNLSWNNISNNINILEEVKYEKLEKLKLNYNKISNNINVLERVNFPLLKELHLSGNSISDITVLEKVNFDNLEKLILSGNKISDNINILERCNFKELKELNLSCNDIYDINVLEKVKFEKLEKINLNKNKIIDISVLEKCNFKELKELNLSINKISDIKVFEKTKFEKLKKLNLSNNCIQKQLYIQIISDLMTNIKDFNI